MVKAQLRKTSPVRMDLVVTEGSRLSNPPEHARPKRIQEYTGGWSTDLHRPFTRKYTARGFEASRPGFDGEGAPCLCLGERTTVPHSFVSHHLNSVLAGTMSRSNHLS
jgi:hypothetical protein